MKREELADLLSGQTTMIATLCELLIDTGAIQKNDLIKRLYGRLALAQHLGTSGAAPFAHLIQILEFEASDPQQTPPPR